LLLAWKLDLCKAWPGVIENYDDLLVF